MQSVIALEADEKNLNQIREVAG